MNFVGIDLHKKSISVGVVGQERKVLNRKRFACADPDRIVGFFKELGLFQAVMEAISSDEWLFKLLEPLAERVVLAHPKKLRIIAESTPRTRWICLHLGVTEQTYDRWRKEYGGVRTDQVKRLKEVEKENARLKKLVADLSLDNAILKEAAYPNF